MGQSWPTFFSLTQNWPINRPIEAFTSKSSNVLRDNNNSNSSPYLSQVASQKLFDVFLDTTNRGPVGNFLKLLYVGQIYWDHVKPIMPPCRTPESIPVLFETQLLSLQLFPIIMVNVKYFGRNTVELNEDDDVIRENFVVEMTKYLTADTFRTTFKWKDYLQQNLTLEDATVALKYVLQSRKFYSRETGKTAFQILVYNLCDLTKLLRQYPQKLNMFSNDSNYLCLALETLATIVDDFSITWKDCLESICITDLTIKLLSFPVWSPKVSYREKHSFINLFTMTTLKFEEQNEVFFLNIFLYILMVTCNT